MRKVNCGTCSSERPAEEMLALENRLICPPCAESHAREANSKGWKVTFSRLIDPTICSKCKTDYGNSDLPLIAGTPFCSNCAKDLYERPYPAWLKFSMAGLLMLLAGSLYLGVPYFKAGRHLVLGERALDHHDYKKADAQFAEVLKVSPTGQKVVLLGAKASIMAGDITQAQKFLNLRETYKQDELYTEVDNSWAHVSNALKAAEKASKLAAENKDEEAAQLMHQASTEYPESEELATADLNYAASAAFDRKDYDATLRITQAAAARMPNDPNTIAFVASALACKYAITGDPEFKKQSEDNLEKARKLAQQSPEEMASYQEYAERIRYRLDTKEIIDKAEYDRRFRQKEAKR